MSFYFVIAALIIDGLVISANIVELALLLKKWNKLDRIEHLLFSLCISDLIAGICAFAQDGKQLKEILLHCETKINDTEGYIFDCLFFFFVFSTNFHVTAMAIERLVAVMLPMRYGIFDTSRCKSFTISLVWVLGLICAPTVTVLTVFYMKKGQKLAGYVLMTICIVVFLSYMLLVIALFIRERKMADLIPQEMKKQMKDRKTTIFCLVIGFSFLICMLPATLGLVNQSLSHPSSNLVLTLNHLINPLIYFAKSYFGYTRRKSTRSTSRLLSRTMSRTLSTTKTFV